MKNITKTTLSILILLMAFQVLTVAQNMDWLMVAQSYAEHDGTEYVLQDSAIIERNTDGKETRRTDLKYDAVTNAWALKEKRDFTLDAAGRFLSIVQSTYVPATQSWVPTNRTDYTYDGNGNTLTTTSSSWQGATSTWRATYRTITTYNAANQVVTQITQSYSAPGDSLVNTLRYENNYNGSNLLTKRLDQAWVSGTWQNQRETINTLDAQGNNTAVQVNRWLTATNTWENFNLDTYAYDAGNRRTEQLRQNWNIGTSTWVNDYRYTYEYDGTGRKIIDRKHNWDATAQDWQTEYVFTTTYGATTQTLVTQRWNNTAQALLNDARITYGTIVNNLREDTYERWSTTNNDWEGNRKEIRTYNPAYNDKQVTYEIRRWNGTSYAGDELTKSYYAQFEVSSVGGLEHLADVSVYPNPFAGQVNFSISPAQAMPVFIKVFNVQGQLVSSLASGETISAPTTFSWNGEGNTPGVYLYQLTIGGTTTSGQLLLVK